MEYEFFRISSFYADRAAVVIAIIAILAAMLLPALRSARETANGHWSDDPVLKK